jgi:hypothetical protein
MNKLDGISFNFRWAAVAAALTIITLFLVISGLSDAMHALSLGLHAHLFHAVHSLLAATIAEALGAGGYYGVKKSLKRVEQPALNR